MAEERAMLEDITERQRMFHMAADLCVNNPRILYMVPPSLKQSPLNFEVELSKDMLSYV